MAAKSLTEELRARGMRRTVQRQLVLQAVQRLRHATPEQVHTAVRQTADEVNLTTVYRTLELLEELGLVTHTHLSHGPPTYHSADDVHLHLVCRSCGGVREAPTALLDDLAARLRAERGFETDIGHVALFGVCAACTDRAADDAARTDRAAGHDTGTGRAAGDDTGSGTGRAAGGAGTRQGAGTARGDG